MHAFPARTSISRHDVGVFSTFWFKTNMPLVGDPGGTAGCREYLRAEGIIPPMLAWGGPGTPGEVGASGFCNKHIVVFGVTFKMYLIYLVNKVTTRLRVK